MVEIGADYWLDLDEQSSVHVKVLQFMRDNEALVEYLDSTPGRTETISLELF